MAVINEIALTEDDVNMKVLTLRAMLIGCCLAALSASVQQLMFFKPGGIGLSSTFMLIVGYVLCTLWAKYLPQGGWLNPGPFTIKEHTCIYILVASANTSAYGTYILSAQALFYENSPSVAGGIFLLLATQIVGYGIAGQLRPYLVYPANMTWPLSLPTVSLIKTLNTDADEAKWRTRFFFIVFGSIFVYEIIPQYIFPMLGGISIICLAKNNNVWVQRVFGGLTPNEGMGVLSLSFDWSFISEMNPLVVPFWVQLNVIGGLFLFWIITPLAYHYNVWNAQSFPFLSNSIFQRFDNGTSIIYPQTAVLNPDNSLNQTLFEAVGNPSFSISNGLSYIYINLGVTATITHVALYHGKDIWTIFRNLRKKVLGGGEVDIHMKLMQAYPEVPNWWFYLVYFVGIGLNIGIGYANGSQLPWWGFILAIVISTVLSLPLNMIQAITGNSFGLNVFAEMVCGFILPGYPIANMYFKTLGFNTMNQAGLMVQDMKISHYLKVPPKMTFLHQIVGTVIGCLFNYIVNESVVKNEREILLSPVGNRFWNGNKPHSINSAAITWGAIGPMAMFGPGTQYYIFLWAFIIGLFLPVPFWLLHKKFPKAGFHYVNTPMVLIGLAGFMPGGSSSFITVSIITIFVSQYYVKRRHSKWYAKHNYLMSAALDSGTSLMAFFVSLVFYGAASGKVYNFPNWWGNDNESIYMDQCCKNCDL
ncbi:OPT family small oligopeptide transporter [Mucor mucedo]|uniref:OPT family small oligopeptide transporter n=1 Tax=Mucor mucedo TaxID=29922 RepID=UPI00221F604B|nr:OPT family small oligopeptide transporter [Mucor mucedo]KAI7888024.1 OPT family small oligopeptide transporter [Mucor mucedo]